MDSAVETAKPDFKLLIIIVVWMLLILARSFHWSLNSVFREISWRDVTGILLLLLLLLWFAGLEFLGGILAQSLEIPREKKREGGRLPPFKLLDLAEIFAFMKRNFPFRKNSLIFLYHWNIIS